MSNIKKQRIAAGITQKALAEALGVTQGAISQWEDGATFPNTKNLKQIAKILNCKVDDLLEEEPEEKED